MDLVGIQNTWIIFAMIVVAFMVPVVALRYFGARWRLLA